MTQEEIKQNIQDAYSKYREKNFWNLFPSGGPLKEPILVFLAEYLTPLYSQLEALQAKDVKKKEK